MKYVVYWIRKTTQTNITTEGYVGITSNFQRRIDYHMNYCYNNPRLKRAIKKYDVVVDLVFEGNEQECKDKEKSLRPQRNIGWNIAEGGGIPPNATGKKWSQSRREKHLKTITEKNSNYRSSEQRQKGILTRQQNGYIEGQNLKPELIAGTVWWTDGKINKRCLQSPGVEWKQGRTKFQKYGEIKTCPFCGKQGKGSGMIRFHFYNCSKAEKGKMTDEAHNGNDVEVDTNKRTKR
jgi:hypothetical protein